MKLADFAGLPILLYKTKLVIEKNKIALYFLQLSNEKHIEKWTGWDASAIKEPDFWFKNVHDEDKDKVYKIMSSIKNGALISHDYRFRKKDGSYLFLNDTFRAVQKAPNWFENIGVIRDITKEKQLEKQLEEDSQLLDVLLNHTPIGIAMYDQQGFIYINDIFENLFGYKLSELKEKKMRIWDLLYSEEDQKIEIKIVEKRIKGEIFDQPWQGVRFLTKDGKIVFADVIGNTIKHDGKYIGVLIIIDITEKHYHEEQLQKLYDKLKELEEYRTSFLRSISHELKTPLNVVYGNIQLMELGVFGNASDFRKPLSSIKAAVESAISLTNNLLDLSKIETKGITVKMRELKASDFKALIDQYKALSSQKGLDFSFEFKVPKIFSGDPKVLSPIISNLLNNAVKYTNSGSVNGYMGFKGNYLVIEVKDTGKGIPPNIRETIFEPFVSGAKGEGTGLGLSVVKKFVEALHGEIKLESEVGKGTTFCVKIPRVVKPVSYERKEKKEVLVIEPDEETRKLLKVILRNHAVVEAETANEGYLKALEHRPDLVITSLSLPDENGNELIKKMRSDVELSDTDFVIYTGARLSEENVDAKVMEKGHDINQIAKELKSLLSEKIVLVFEESVSRYIKRAEEIVHSFSTKEIIVKKFSDLTEELIDLHDTFVLLVPNDLKVVRIFMNRFVATRRRGLVILMMLMTDGGDLIWHT